ncbi:MAG: general secretion pathway protein GspE [Deltaproteobacteria bacterium]|nr:general secretion pathway protein GspE [Deltaproteobacteria bacterium]
MASRIADILVRAKLIDDLQLRSAIAHQQQWGGRLADIVIEKRFAPEDKVTEAIAEGMKLPKVDLDQIEHDVAALNKVEMSFARAHAVFPCALKDGGKTLWLAMADPTDVPVVDELSLKTRVRIKLVVASERQILSAIKRGYLGESEASPGVSYGAIAPIELTGDDDGKIVDMSGHTLVKSIKDIIEQAGQRAETAEKALGTQAPRRSSTAGNVLDDLLGGDAPRHAWTPEDLGRLRSAQDQQEKSARILRAVHDLCVSKGLFQPDEYRRKAKNLP